MKKHATIVKHSEGMFLAINGDLNKRELVVKGFCKGLSTIKQFYHMISKTNGTGYTSYDYAPKAIVTECDLSHPDDDDITIDSIWDPNLHTVDLKTGEVTLIPERKRAFVKETEDLIESSKSLQTIMDTKSKASVGSTKGWETRRANIKAQIDAKEQEDLRFKAEDRAKSDLAEGKRIAKEKHWTDNVTPEQAKAFNDAIAISNLWKEAHKELDQYNLDNEKLWTKDIADIEKRIDAKLNKFNSDAKDSPAHNNPVNHNDMNKQKDVSKDTKPSNGRRTRRTLAKITEVSITITTDLAIGSLIFTGDLLYLGASAIAWGQAKAIKPLGLHPDATIAELKKAAIDRAENRSTFVIALPVAAIALPKRAYLASKAAMKMRNDKGIVDIQNAEVVA